MATQPHDPRFDRIARLAAWTFEVPVAVVSLIGEHWQHLQACYGIEEPEDLPRELAFCSHTILSDEVLVVEDVRQDERAAAHPMVIGPPCIRFYAGAPLLASDGHRLGTLCLIDHQPRALSADERARLKDLAVLVVDEMELCREIEERQQVEHALRASEARFRALNEHALDIVAIIDPEATLTYVTPSVENTLGYTVDELVGRGGLDMLHPDDVPPARATLQASLEHPDEPQHLELRFRHRDGSWRWLSIKARNLLDHDGVEGILLNVNDVTERCEAEQALQRAKTKYETLFTTASDPILIFEPDDEVILEANPQACAFYGYERDALIGTSLRLLSRDPEARRGDVERTLEEGRIQNLETVHLRRDGTPAHVLVSACRIDYDGHTAILSINRDVSERRTAREALQQTLERERELSELKSRFVAMASHELRTPLATIQSSAELIERFRTRWEKEKTDKHLQRILNNVQDMTMLLEDVLLLGRTGSDHLPFEPRRMPLRPFAANLIDEMQGSLGARHAIVLDAGEEVSAEVDATLLRLVLNNLLTNAVKYSPEGATVRVGLRPEPGAVVLDVEDTGIGIPEADRARLFEPFHRASNVGARRGTGLGLSIVRRAVDMHGGHIHLESREGDGTTATVRLPLRQPAPDERPAAGARRHDR